ncbi:MAG: acyl CoA:acetate/3-ketoacid CoA transferase [Nitrosopumilales archaeon]|nr:MAG: acyl CoA:acetate/3-ketoacid CoA transferase [Nitrosopumilales archaeon]
MSMMNKVTESVSVFSQIKDNCVIAISGFNLATTPEYLILELYRHYNEFGHPKNMFIVSDALPAVPNRALDSIAETIYKDENQEFLRGMLMPFLGFSPWLQRLVIDDRIEFYGWPIGITAYWFREVASGRPGLITKIGIGTFLDPRKEGGALNEMASRKMSCKINIINIESEDYLLYRAPKPDYALIRATTADESGNLSMEDEGIRGTVLAIAQATKARPNQGTVFAQTRWLTKMSTINPRDVDIPSPLVDYIIISPQKYHWQSGTIEYDPRISYRTIPPITEKLVAETITKPIAQYERIIARRILIELIKLFKVKGSPVLVNLGIGIPALVSSVAAEENLADFIVTVIESGPWGGIALSGTNFGQAISPFALSTIPDMFSNFEGGIIDVASLGFLQVDKYGNVNPSILSDRIFGPGGFPVIAGGAPKNYFAGAFTAGPKVIDIVNNRLSIVHDGSPKFVDNVYKIIFSGDEAMKYEKEILYVTERAVFRLTEKGLTLEEVSPGVDIDRDILSKMEFRPIIATPLKQMDERLFGVGKLGLREEIF